MHVWEELVLKHTQHDWKMISPSSSKILGFLDCRSGNKCYSSTQWQSSMYRDATHYFHTALKAHYGCVNAIEFSRNETLLASGRLCPLIYVDCRGKEKKVANNNENVERMHKMSKCMYSALLWLADSVWFIILDSQEENNNLALKWE